MNDTHTNLPQHIAIIMDGNGRWARQRGLPRVAGHRAGVEATRNIIKTCGERSIKALTLFAFGLENWRRPKTEVEHLMQLFAQALQKEIKELHKHNVRFRVVGDITRFSGSLQKKFKQAEALTAQNTGLKLVIAASYSGQWDITQACQRIAEKVANKELEPSAVTPDLINGHLATAGITPPDLLIRTSGESRISNFMLWQLAYTELYFSPVCWPDFTAAELEKALQFYQERERRFGCISEQLKEHTVDA